MKLRILCLLLTLSLALAACGGETVPQTTAPETTQPPTTQAPTTEPTTAPTEPPRPLTVGQLSEGVYRNDYAGFGCTLDESWTFYGADMLQELPGEVAELLKEDADLYKALQAYPQISAMMAESVDPWRNVNVLYQSSPEAERAYLLALGETGMIDWMLTEQKQMMLDAYAQTGMSITRMERRTVPFLGQERSVLYTAGNNRGVDFFMVQLFDYSRGSYAVITTCTSYLSDQTQEMLDLFFPVEEEQ